jgi:hypothetical protein
MATDAGIEGPKVLRAPAGHQRVREFSRRSVISPPRSQIPLFSERQDYRLAPEPAAGAQGRGKANTATKGLASCANTAIIIPPVFTVRARCAVLGSGLALVSPA